MLTSSTLFVLMIVPAVSILAISLVVAIFEQESF